MLNYVDSNYVEALQDFESASNIKKDESENDYFYAAAAALRIGDEKKAKEFIKAGIIYNNADRVYFKNFQEFDGYRNSTCLISINENYEMYQNDFRRQLEFPDIYDEIERMLVLDQSVRNGGYSAEEMINQDSLNILRLIEITREYGWQEKSLLLLWHQRGTFKEDDFVWSYFRPLIDSLISDCQIRRDHWAKYEDFYAMFNEGKQEYGTMWANYHDYPIKDIMNIDKKRDSVGMPSIWYMNKVYGANLPDGYIVPLKN